MAAAKLTRYFHHFCRECGREEMIRALKSAPSPKCHGRMAYKGVVEQWPNQAAAFNRMQDTLHGSKGDE